MNENLIVPFEKKDEVKELGAFWDADVKMWYMPKKIKELEKYKRTEIYVPFEDKDIVKDMGAKWDSSNKIWVISKYESEKFKKWITRNIIFLDIPFEEKDNVKKIGGKWDSKQKKWYFENTSVPAEFQQYICKI
jgi:DNA topoisomerase-3